MTKANHIHFTAQTNQADDLAAFLTAGRDLVVQTEPETLYWFALRNEANPEQLAIFDVFPHQGGRQAHFEGDVARALMDKAPTLVRGGWDEGVLANVSNYAVVASSVRETPPAVTRASYIPFKAAPGKEAALEQFLAAGANMVTQGEPQTAYWYALRDEDRRGHYAIFDLFADEAGRDAHFAGQVAAALEEASAELVEGGWQDGVLAGVVHAEVMAAR